MTYKRKIVYVIEKEFEEHNGGGGRGGSELLIESAKSAILGKADNIDINEVVTKN